MHRRLLAAAILLPLAAAGAAEASAPKKKGGGAAFMPIPTLAASIPRPDGRRGVLTVECGVDTQDEALRTRVEQLKPRLRDAYNTTLMRFASGMRPGLAPDADRLAKEMQSVTDKVVGKAGAKFLLGTILVS